MLERFEFFDKFQKCELPCNIEYRMQNHEHREISLTFRDYLKLEKLFSIFLTLALFYRL